MESLYELKNPVANDLSITYKGIEYKVVGYGEIKNIPKEVADFWSDTHQFLKFKKQVISAKLSKVETIEEVIEEVKEEVVEIPTITETIEEVKEEVVVETKTKAKK